MTAPAEQATAAMGPIHHPVPTIEQVTLLRVTFGRGAGTEGSVYRNVVAYMTLDGQELLWVDDPVEPPL